MPPTIPAADAKIGKKIDYLAAELGRALAPHGFVRKARKIWRETGQSHSHCFSIVDLQGDKWNEVSVGKFCVNIGVQFPALLSVLAELTDAPWLGEGASVPDTALANIRGRLDDALPTQRESWWLPEMGPHDIWFKVERRTDLAALSEVLIKSVHGYVLPWLDQYATLDAIVTTAGRMGSSLPAKIAACVFLERREEAQAMLRQSNALKVRQEDVDRLVAWLSAQAIAVPG